MQKSIKEKQARRKRDAVRGLLFFGVLQVITCVAFLALCFIPGLPSGLSPCFWPWAFCPWP